LSSILYYITGHGFGHAVRSNQVIHSLRQAAPALRIYVRTTAPTWLFDDVSVPIAYSKSTIDVGIVQKDSLEMDLNETLRACRALHGRMAEVIEEELQFLRQHDIRLILADIPPLAFEIAARASIPSVAITNFTWSWIYRAYLEKYPIFLPLIEEMESFYCKATLALTLPYPSEMDVFAKRTAIPWIARASSLSRPQARARFALPDSATVVLLSFGGLGLERLPWNSLLQLRDLYFVTTSDSPRREGNLSVFPDAQRSYQELVRAADVIVTKPGYGIVADVIAHRVPILYTARGEFPEYPHLVQALRDLATAEFISQDDLFSGNIEPHIAHLLAKDPNWPAVALNGAAIAAEKILALLGSE
jgi:UDP:flavonoid glycosyltransferase YjiC (YdhE family)